MQKNNMAQVAKTQKRKRKIIISKADWEKLKDAHFQLYSALFYRELLSGKTIGAASHNAFEFIKAKLKSMNNGPIKRFLAVIHFVRSKETKRRIMPSKNRDALVAFIPEQQKKFEAKIPTDISNALNIINTLSSKYKPVTKSVAKSAQQPKDLPTIEHYKKQLSGVTSVVGILVQHKQNNGK